MSPDGGLAADFVARGYPVETHPSWFGTRQQLDASLVEVDATLVELVALVDETLDDTVYTPKNAVPKEQGSQVTHSAAQRTATATQRGAARRNEVNATATGINEHHNGGAAESVAAERRHLRGGERHLGEDLSLIHI